MNQDYFVMRPRIVTVLGWGLLSLLGVAAIIWAAVYFIVMGAGSYEELIFGGLLVIIVSFGSIAGLITRGIWKCTIQGNHILYWSLISRIKFAFDDIERVELDIMRSHRAPDLKTLHIYLYGRKRWLSIPSKSTNSNLFLECLKSRKILGSETL